MIQELIKRASNKFIPTDIDDFIGNNVVTTSSGQRTGARTIAKQIRQAVHTANANDQMPLKFLLNGHPGIGKSALALYAQHLTGCNHWNTTKLNGTECKIERIEEMARTLQFKNIFGEWRMLWIDEADEIPRVAQVRFLTLLDDLPNGAIVICTSNCRLGDFELRFQTRFQAFELTGPDETEIESFLLRLAPDLGVNAKRIATCARGNVRQALLDAQGMVQHWSPIHEPMPALVTVG